MSRQSALSTVLVVVAALITGSIIFLHHADARLAARIADFPRTDTGRLLREENARLRQVLKATQAHDGDAARQIHAELVRVRTEVARREQQADADHARLLAQADRDAADLVGNRDPTRGLVRLENFLPAGQATPTAACETLVWATMKGDSATLANLFVLTDAARARAEEWIAGLPVDARAQWSPEKLADLYFTAAATDVSSAQITGESFDDPSHATVQLRIPGVDAAKTRMKLRLGPAGWQITVTPHDISVIRRRVAPAQPPTVP